MKRLFILIGLLMLTITLSSCSSKSGLVSVGLEGLTGKEILIGVADGGIIVDGFGLSVYDDELIVILDEDRISLDMPKDEFYLSVAPYINTTHPCEFHSATGCRGELKLETFMVEFIDLDGNILISQNMTSMSNGFIDLWLPRNVEGTLIITQGELSATKLISTTTGEPTCETTMKLS